MRALSENVEEGGQQEADNAPDQQSGQDGPDGLPESHGAGDPPRPGPGPLLGEVHGGGLPDGLRGPYRLVPHRFYSYVQYVWYSYTLGRKF